MKLIITKIIVANVMVLMMLPMAYFYAKDGELENYWSEFFDSFKELINSNE